MRADTDTSAVKFDVQAAMDRMYRPQKLIYDLTRKYYLIGRDPMIAGIKAQPGQTIVDIGCGTGRNLIQMRKAYPQSRLIGIEPADAMLEVAHTALEKHGLINEIELIKGVAKDLPNKTQGQIDHATISYAISMMPEPIADIRAVLSAIRPSGTLHIVDFGPFNRAPALIQNALRNWLNLFGVHWKPDVESYLRENATAGLGKFQKQSLFGGYAEIMRFTKDHETL